jgi:hypothetical protein
VLSDAPQGLRRYPRARAFVLLGIIASASVAMASPASAVFATENVSFISVTGAGSAHIVSAHAVTASPEALSEAGQAANLVKHLAGERATTAEV